MTPPTLVVVMVNHDHGEELKRAVDSLFGLPDRQTFQLTVVDNASRDGCADWLARHHPAVRLLCNQQRYGFSRNINHAIRHSANSGFLLLMNPDIECLPGLLDRLVEAMGQGPDIGIAGPQLLNPDGSVQPSARRFSTPPAILMRGLRLDQVLPRARWLSTYLMDDVDRSQAVDVDWVTGALMMVRRAALTEVGLMDERFFLYAEDQDWCCRMWQAGWRVRLVPEARAFHRHHRLGMRRPWSRAGAYQITSAIQLFAKYRGRLQRNR